MQRRATCVLFAAVVAGTLGAAADEPSPPSRSGKPEADTARPAGPKRPSVRDLFKLPLGTEQSDPDAAPDKPLDPSSNLRSDVMKTLGGRQFWGDVHFFHGWRIQRNVFTGHYRLLDETDDRQTWGTLDDCRKKLAEIRDERKLPPMKGKAVIVVHGIIRSSKSFAAMTTQLGKEGYTVFGFDYPSTQIRIPEIAEYLHSCIQSLDGIEEINFVVHSMGGLVVRQYLAKHEDRRIARMVMLGVPNNGAEMADMFQKNILFKAIFGPAGQQLITGENGLIAKLPTPEFEFAVISGAKGNDAGFNPLLDGDDDGTVRLESTRLPGAADFATVKCLHSFLMNDPGAVEMTCRFFREGRLRAEGETQPIPKPVAELTPASAK